MSFLPADKLRQIYRQVGFVVSTGQISFLLAKGFCNDYLLIVYPIFPGIKFFCRVYRPIVFLYRQFFYIENTGPLTCRNARRFHVVVAMARLAFYLVHQRTRVQTIYNQSTRSMRMWVYSELTFPFAEVT